MNHYLDFHTHHSEKKEIQKTQSVINIRAFHDEDIIEKITKTNDYFTYGLHPWDIAGTDNESQVETYLERLDQLGLHPNFLAPGEIGLDRSRKENFQKQKVLFENLITSQSFKNFPFVILHNVRSSSDILEIIKKNKVTKTFISHDYNGSIEEMKSLVKSNFSFSFGPKILTPQTKAFETIKQTPLDRIFFETDEQTQYSLSEIYSQASKLLGISLDKLLEQVNRNFESLKTQRKSFDG
ncbi:MAG: TatD family hydrolase [Bacteriovoracaceae bacterium]